MSTPVVLITGALTGIGRATAIAFAKEGARLVVSGRKEAEGKALEAELRRLGVEAEFVIADVRHEKDISNLVDRAVARFDRLDVAINNAGTEGKPGPLTDVSVETYSAMFDTNVLGVVLSLKHELRFMQAQGSGSIVNISSTMGERGAANLSLYSGSKHAVEGITKTAALEGAVYGVRVNAVAPGPTETAMLDRLTGSAEESGVLCGRSAEAACVVRRDRRRDRFRRVRQSGVHHWPDHSGQRGQDGQLIAVADRRRVQATPGADDAPQSMKGVECRSCFRQLGSVRSMSCIAWSLRRLRGCVRICRAMCPTVLWRLITDSAPPAAD